METAPPPSGESAGGPCPPWRCGDSACYTETGCRCRWCRTAHLLEVSKRLADVSSPVACGTRSRYNKGCRCPDCTRANREYIRDREGRKSREERTREGRAHLPDGEGCGCGAPATPYPTSRFVGWHRKRRLPNCWRSRDCLNLQRRLRRTKVGR